MRGELPGGQGSWGLRGMRRGSGWGSGFAVVGWGQDVYRWASWSLDVGVPGVTCAGLASPEATLLPLDGRLPLGPRLGILAANFPFL